MTIAVCVAAFVLAKTDLTTAPPSARDVVRTPASWVRDCGVLLHPVGAAAIGAVVVMFQMACVAAVRM